MTEYEQGVTLTQVAFWGRRAIEFGIIGIVVLLVGRTLLNVSVAYWKATHPPAPPPPTVGFDVLPPIHFPAQTADQKPQSYRIETANGRFPRFSDRARVYAIPKSTPNLLSDQRAKEVAANYGYPSLPTVLSERTYRWTKSSPLQSTLEMDILDFTFDLTSNYIAKPELVSGNELPTEDAAVRLVKSFIGSGQTLPDDIATVSGEVRYLKSLGGELGEAESFSDADFMRVDLLRAAIDTNKPVLTAKGKEGIIHAIITGALGGRDQVVELQNHYRPVDYLDRHTYPIRPVATAWQTLQSGQGYIANKGSGDRAVIRSVYIGYFEDEEEQDYLQPIYIFEGDDGFLGYVPAVDPSWIQVVQEEESQVFNQPISEDITTTNEAAANPE